MVMKQLLLKDRKLDIAEEFDDYTFDIVRHDLYGVPAYVIYSKNEYDLVAVYDNCHLIWQQNHPNDKAAFVIVHGELSTTTLINVLVKGQGESYNLYYNKNGSDWEQTCLISKYSLVN
uniref:Uncharacterized protein n=1 Tax=Theileria parva TaxID=5875 RepID=Q4N5T3_THEPA|eukprot:XP_764773.1 hypothetical protein [Theileria parva strain Muguga]